MEDQLWDAPLQRARPVEKDRLPVHRRPVSLLGSHCAACVKKLETTAWTTGTVSRSHDDDVMLTCRMIPKAAR